jgi:hypothetical protein
MSQFDILSSIMSGKTVVCQIFLAIGEFGSYRVLIPKESADDFEAAAYAIEPSTVAELKEVVDEYQGIIER